MASLFFINEEACKKNLLSRLHFWLYWLLHWHARVLVSGTAPAQPANVETIVAATFAALTAPAAEASATPLPLTVSLLPHSMYFLNNDGAGLTQVYRLDKDGKTVTQVTFEPANVESYDVSSVDGSVVYATNNQLFTVNADGSNRSMIVDGGPLDPNDAFVNHINVPLWSPDGQTIAYGYQRDQLLFNCRWAIHSGT